MKIIFHDRWTSMARFHACQRVYLLNTDLSSLKLRGNNVLPTYYYSCHARSEIASEICSCVKYHSKIVILLLAIQMLIRYIFIRTILSKHRGSKYSIIKRKIKNSPSSEIHRTKLIKELRYWHSLF